MFQLTMRRAGWERQRDLNSHSPTSLTRGPLTALLRARLRPRCGLQAEKTLRVRGIGGEIKVAHFRRAQRARASLVYRHADDERRHRRAAGAAD